MEETRTRTETRSSTSTDTDPKSWLDSRFFRGMERLRPFLQWTVLVFFFFFGLYLYQRDVNGAQVYNLSDLKREQDVLKNAVSDAKADRARDNQEIKTEIQALKNEMVSREVYQTTTESQQREAEYQRKLLEQLLERRGQ